MQGEVAVKLKRAERMSRLGTETAFEVLAEVNKLVRQGRSIVSFCIGEPDFDTPANVKSAGMKAIENNYTHYGPSAGLDVLRETIADYMTKTRGIAYSPDEIVVTPGAKPIIFHGILATVDPGDEVLYPNPGFPIYESVINFIGARPVPIPLLEEKDFSLDVDDLRRRISPRTKMIIINSPQNPTGGMLSKQDLEAIAEMAIEHDLWVMSDEVYSRIVYDGEFFSIASIPGMKERTIVIDGFSKTYAMTGWRMGWGAMNEALARDVARLETNCESCTASFTQIAGVEALTGPQDATASMVSEFAARRDILVRGLNAIDGVTCVKPKGAFYAFPNVTAACKRLSMRSAKELQEYLLYDAGVAVLPRTSFGSKNDGEDQEYIRLSYATSRENIAEGLRRMKAVLEKG
jgi:aspartate aminotransferase